MRHETHQSRDNQFPLVDELLRKGNRYEAVSRLQQVVAGAKSQGDEQAQVLALYKLSETLADAGDTRSALGSLRELTGIVRKGSVSGELAAKALVLSGRLNLEESELAEAREALEAGLALLENTELPDRDRLRILARLYLGKVSQAEDRLEEALELYRGCLELFDMDDRPCEAAEILQSMALTRVAQGVFDEANELMSKAIQLLEGVKEKGGMAQAYSQLGALFLRQEDLHRAVEAYQRSLALYEELQNAPARRRILFNLGAIQNMIAARSGEYPSKGLDNFLRARLVADECGPDGRAQRELTALHRLVDEEFERNIVTKWSVRFSRNFDDSMRNLARGILTASWQGDLVEEGRLRLLRGKLIFNFASRTRDRSLLKFALTDFIWSGEVKAIQGAFSKHEIFENQQDVSEYLDWLLGSYWMTPQRRAVATALGCLSPYCPDAYLDEVFAQLVELADGPFSLFADLDLKRPALKALGLYGAVFKRSQRTRLIEELASLLPREDFRVAGEVLGAVIRIRYKDLPVETKLFAVDRLLELAETDYRDIPKVYNALTALALESGRMIRDRVAEFLLSRFDDNADRTAAAVYLSWLAGDLAKDRRQALAKHLLSLLDAEVQAARHDRVELGTLQLPLPLTNYLPRCENSIRSRIVDSLLTYIQSPNIAGFKQVGAIEGLIRQASVLSEDDKAQAERVLLHIAVAGPESRPQPLPSMGSPEMLRGLACLALTRFRTSELRSLSRVLLRLSSLADDDARYQAVRAMGEMLQYAEGGTREQALTTLYQKTFDTAYVVRGEALIGFFGAPRVLASEIGGEGFARLLHLQGDPHPWVRERVALVLGRILCDLDSSGQATLREALTGLASDVNVWVRREAQRSLRSLKRGRTTGCNA